MTNILEHPDITRTLRTGYNKPQRPVRDYEFPQFRICGVGGCEDVAKIKVNGINHCWECAGDVGIEKL